MPFNDQGVHQFSKLSRRLESRDRTIKGHRGLPVAAQLTGHRHWPEHDRAVSATVTGGRFPRGTDGPDAGHTIDCQTTSDRLTHRAAETRPLIGRLQRYRMVGGRSISQSPDATEPPPAVSSACRGVRCPKAIKSWPTQPEDTEPVPERKCEEVARAIPWSSRRPPAERRRGEWTITVVF